MSSGGNRYLAVLLVVLISMLIASCSQENGRDRKNPDRTIENKTVLADLTDSIVIELAGIDSMTVFDLLKADHRVVSKLSVQGVYVTGIDGITNTRDHFWLYSVNDIMATVAADRYVTVNSDRVRWHYRKLTR